MITPTLRIELVRFRNLLDEKISELKNKQEDMTVAVTNTGGILGRIAAHIPKNTRLSDDQKKELTQLKDKFSTILLTQTEKIKKSIEPNIEVLETIRDEIKSALKGMAPTKQGFLGHIFGKQGFLPLQKLQQHGNVAVVEAFGKFLHENLIEKELSYTQDSSALEQTIAECTSIIQSAATLLEGISKAILKLEHDIEALRLHAGAM